ncbi:MAG: hypothetical protein PUC14_00010 [Bacteroidales bacterium]|nr:hypothetical protein [Bacteroidales bacterium]
MAKVIIPPYNGYNTWEYRIADWYAGRPMGTWTDPNIIPLVNNIALGTNSGDYIPEPWWGNHDMDIPLHSVVINFNPGQGGNIQHRNAIPNHIPYHGDYGRDIVDSGCLSKTAKWHENKRALPILNALKRIRVLPTNYIPSLDNHLSVELIPWHTENTSAKCGFGQYLKDNILNVYEYAICFAAHESKRIANEKLRNVVILRLSETNTKNLLKLLGGIGYSSIVSHKRTVPETKSHCFEFTINRLPGVRFFSIWGSNARNNFPKGSDMDYILENFV